MSWFWNLLTCTFLSIFSFPIFLAIFRLYWGVWEAGWEVVTSQEPEERCVLEPREECRTLPRILPFLYPEKHCSIISSQVPALPDQIFLFFLLLLLLPQYLFPLPIHTCSCFQVCRLRLTSDTKSERHEKTLRSQTQDTDQKISSIASTTIKSHQESLLTTSKPLSSPLSSQTPSQSSLLASPPPTFYQAPPRQVQKPFLAHPSLVSTQRLRPPSPPLPSFILPFHNSPPPTGPTATLTLPPATPSTKTSTPDLLPTPPNPGAPSASPSQATFSKLLLLTKTDNKPLTSPPKRLQPSAPSLRFRLTPGAIILKNSYRIQNSSLPTKKFNKKTEVSKKSYFNSSELKPGNQNKKSQAKRFQAFIPASSKLNRDFRPSQPESSSQFSPSRGPQDKLLPRPSLRHPPRPPTSAVHPLQSHQTRIKPPKKFKPQVWSVSTRIQHPKRTSPLSSRKRSTQNKRNKTARPQIKTFHWCYLSYSWHYTNFVLA